MENRANDFFNNLTALSEAAFPKHCKTCGVLYHSAEDFITKTQSLRGKSGLKSTYDDNDLPIVELYRNCSCGSTLMDFFSDRRDCSEKGAQRRELFEQLMKTLETHAITRAAAREELLKMLRGETSDIIENLGLVGIRQGSEKL